MHDAEPPVREYAAWALAQLHQRFSVPAVARYMYYPPA